MATELTRKRLITASLITAALVIVAQSVAHLIATIWFGVCDATGFGRCPSILDLDRSNGVSDVVSTGVIGAAALGAAVLGVRRRPREMAALALAAVLVFVAFDDAFHLEDNVGDVDGVIVLATILCAAALTLLVALGVPSGSRWALLGGILLLALDAKAPFFYDRLMNAVDQSELARGDLLYELGVVLDEAAELAGWTLVAVGLWDAALAEHPRAGTTGMQPQLGVGSTSATSESRATSDA